MLFQLACLLEVPHTTFFIRLHMEYEICVPTKILALFNDDLVNGKEPSVTSNIFNSIVSLPVKYPVQLLSLGNTGELKGGVMG